MAGAIDIDMTSKQVEKKHYWFIHPTSKGGARKTK